jgi:hypothetical protein
MSKSRKLTKEDRRLFYAARQVRFLLAWKELAAVADMLNTIDPTLARLLHDICTDFFEAVPTSPAARAEAQRLSSPLSVMVERRRQEHIERLRQAVRELKDHKDKGLVNLFKRDLEIYERPAGVILAQGLAASRPENDDPIDDEQQRIDQVVRDLLSTIDF